MVATNMALVNARKGQVSQYERVLWAIKTRQSKTASFRAKLGNAVTFVIYYKGAPSEWNRVAQWRGISWLTNMADQWAYSQSFLVRDVSLLMAEKQRLEEMLAS